MWNKPSHVLSRDELYDMVWTEPVETIAHRYKLAGNGLAKICRKHRIPLSPRGYWAKVKHGKKPPRTPLRSTKDPTDLRVHITEGSGPRPAPPPLPKVEPPIAAAIERALLPENRILVPETTSRLHRLVLEMAQLMDRSWDGQRKTADPIEVRRRCILDAFVRAVERIKGTVGQISDSGYFEVTLYGSVFKLLCSEPEKRVRVKLDARELRTRESWDTRDWKTETLRSGILRIRVQGEGERDKDFSDRADKALEDHLTDVLVYLLRRTITVQERDRRAKAEREAKAELERQRRLEELRRWELEDERRLERKRVTELIEDAEMWRKAQDVRAFVADARGGASADWVAWALGVADSIDPSKADKANKGAPAV